MKNRKNLLIKIAAAAVCALMLCTLFASCHKGKAIVGFVVPGHSVNAQGEEVIDPEYELSGNYEITFWAKNDTNVAQTKIYKEAIEDFEALYPNIKVNMKLYTDYNMIYRDVITNIPTHTTPNLCISYPDNVAAYLAGDNTVVPLDDLISDPYYGLGGSKLKFDGPSMTEIVPQFIEEGKLEGHYYCLPYMRSTEALYVNKTFVEKLGYTLPDIVTWDFVFEVSEKALEKNADGTYMVSGKNVLIPFIYKSTDNMMIQMLKQLGAGYSKDNGEVLIFNDTTRKLLLDISPHAKTKAFSTFKIVSYPGNYFNAGECIFAVDSTAGATWIGSNSPLKEISDDKLVDFETVTLPVPQFDTNAPKMISQGPSMCIFNKDDPEEVLATWLFAQFLLTNKVQIAYARTEGYVPVTLKAQETEEYKDYLSRAGEDNDDFYHVKIDAAKLLLSNQENTFVTPVFNHSADLRNAAGQLIEEVVKSNNRREEVNDAYIDALYAKVTKLYGLDEIEVKNGGEEENKKQELGRMPVESIALLTVLGVTWVGLAAYFINEKLKEKKKKSG